MMEDRVLSPIQARYSFHCQYVHVDMPRPILERLNGWVSYADVEDAKLYARIYHELQHFAQNVFTSYGLWKSLVLKVTGGVFLYGLIDLIKAGVPIVIPIDKMLLRGAKDYGRLQPFMLAKTARQPIALMERTHVVPEGTHLDGVASPATTTSPFVRHNGVVTSVTATTLMEFQAYLSEMLFLVHEPTILDADREPLISTVANYANYTLPIALAKRAFGLEGHVPDAPFIAFELATLALSPRLPENAAFALIPGTKKRMAAVDDISWEDVHPGWRYMRILETIKDHRLDFPMRQDGATLVDALCAILRWPRPIDATTNTLEAFEANDYESSTMHPFINLKAHIAEVARWPMLSYDYHLKVVRDPKFRGFVRGPIAKPVGLDWPGILAEVASQLYFETKVLCPACISYEHESWCRVPRFLAFEKVTLDSYY